MATRLVRIAICIAAVCIASPAAAQTPKVADLRDGDCLVTVIDVPATTDVHGIGLFVDGALLTVRPAERHGGNVQLKLLAPLHENSSVAADVPPAGMTAPTRVTQARQQSEPPATSCAEPTPRDDRSVFEASAYLGQSFDNFAPFERDQYIPGKEQQQPGVYGRWLAGVEAQYRLVGNQGDDFQFWLGTHTLHGVRTADVNCNETPSSGLCSESTQQRFLATLEHQSSIEAHVDARVEFLTLQRSSDVPIKLFVVGRFGFVNVSGAPKVFNSDQVAIGVLSPIGVFRGSNAMVGWGHSDQFQSNPGWNRLKISGTLLFDVMPGFRDQLEFWKRLAGSPRVFVSITVDRNPGGPGPDSVTSYVGVDIDLRHMFFGYGG
jgi:hypothetical protein